MHGGAEAHGTRGLGARVGALAGSGAAIVAWLRGAGPTGPLAPPSDARPRGAGEPPRLTPRGAPRRGESPLPARGERGSRHDGHCPEKPLVRRAGESRSTRPGSCCRAGGSGPSECVY